jgi:hypothetical protein
MADVAPSVIKPPRRRCTAHVGNPLPDHIADVPTLLVFLLAMVSLRLAAMVVLPVV